MWLWEKYVEWDAVAFLLHIINAAPLCVPLDRAWSVIDVFFSDWNGRVTDVERWRRLGELRAKAAAKHSISAASMSGMTVSLPDERPPGTPCEVGLTDILGTAEAMQSNADPALDSNCTMDFTSGYTNTFDNEYTEAAGMGDGVEWTFDNFSFTQGGPIWDMDFNDDAFRVQGND
jgi:hypothetical protein